MNSGIKQYIFSHIRFYRFYTIVYGNVDWLVLRRQIESLEDKCKNFSCIIFYFGMIESKILSLTSLCNHQGSASKSLFKALNSNWHAAVFKTLGGLLQYKSRVFNSIKDIFKVEICYLTGK